MAAPAATHAARGGRRGSRGCGGRGHVGAVGGACRPPVSGFPFAACGGLRAARCCGAGEAGAEGLTAGALLLWERGGTPACEQAFPALSCRVERLFLPKVTGRLDASRGGTVESEATARVTHN